VCSDPVRILRDRGYKATRQRKLVLQMLDEAQGPLSPYDIRDTLRARGKYLNHVTIYRVLDLLCNLNLVHKMPSSGKYVRCSLHFEEGCHRFLICQSCGTVCEFADKELCREENEFARVFGFHTEHHLSEFLGLCSRCYRE
jgi:Fur family transcriptional regulator, zinc uptake regulator